MTEPTENARAFMKANDASGVVEGSANGPGKGGRYTLANDTTFNLSVADCRSLPEGYPRWLFPEDPITVSVRIVDLCHWRTEWLEANDPQDGTDCVTPFDGYLYGSATDTSGGDHG